MSSFETKGKLIVKYNTQQVTERFKKREFVVEIPSGNFAEQVKFQLTQDKCELLDRFKEGEELIVYFNLKGKPYTKDGVTSYFNNLDAWRLETAKESKAGNDTEPPLPEEFTYREAGESEENLPF
jgi:single-strand DNA-binding protein